MGLNLDSIQRFLHMHQLFHGKPAAVEVKLKKKSKGKVMGQLVWLVVGRFT